VRRFGEDLDPAMRELVERALDNKGLALGERDRRE